MKDGNGGKMSDVYRYFLEGAVDAELKWVRLRQLSGPSSTISVEEFREYCFFRITAVRMDAVGITMRGD